MELILKRQTHWGCVRHFTIYKNGVRQGRLFNGVSTTIEAEAGDTLEFREGLFHFCRKITVKPTMKEIVIKNSNNLLQLLLSFIFLFLVASACLFTIDSLIIFSLSEALVLLALTHIFRYSSYQFHLDSQEQKHRHTPQCI